MSAEAIAAVLEEVDAADPGAAAGPAPRRFCFVAGTHIATLRGEMPVEQLRVGDHIRARKGSFHIVTEVMVVEFDDLPPDAQSQVGVYPLKRGAIDEGLPRRDIFVSAGQQFELSRRLEIAHAVRMAVRKEGAALRGFRFVLFACPGLPMIRSEGVWTTLTPMERAFPLAPAPTEAEGEADESGAEREEASAAPSPALSDDPPPAASPLLSAGGDATHDGARRPTRRPVSRFLRTPVSMPASHHTATGTPDP
jgi:hypothetical protein